MRLEDFCACGPVYFCVTAKLTPVMPALRGPRRAPGRRPDGDAAPRPRSASGPGKVSCPTGEHWDPDLLADGDRRNVVDEYRYWTHEAIVADLDSRRHNFHVAIENWQHDLNIGTVVRTANAFLAKEVHIIGRRRWNRRGAMVTDRYQHVRHHPTVEDFVAWAQGEGLAIIGIDIFPDSVPLETYDLPENCVLVFGQEGPGPHPGSPRRGRGDPLDRAVRLHPVHQRRVRGGHRHARLDPPPRLRPARPGHVGSRRHPAVAAQCYPAGVTRNTGRAPVWLGWLLADEVHSRVHQDPQTKIHLGVSMPIATPEIYSEMIDRAKAGGFAFPAVNVTSSQTLNAALRGFAEAESDGIIQVSTGGAAYWSGASTKDMVAGSLGFAAFAREVAKNYGVNIALHTDHCPKDKLDGFVLPLLAASEAEVKAGRDPLFNSHMWDGSAETLQENLRIARELLERTAAAKMILEVEIGTVGGEEDGVENAINDKLYTTVEDALATIEALGAGENGRYITALTFGNVHGVYKPGGVKLRPEILKDIQAQVGAKIGKDNPFDLVFHGGSGSSDQEIADAVSYGVIKMNIDTDTQYAYTRPVADHMFRNYDGVLKVDGEVGNKKTYDPRVWGASAEAGLAARVVEATKQLGSAGKTF